MSLSVTTFMTALPLRWGCSKYLKSAICPHSITALQKGDRNAGDVGEGPGEARCTRAVSQGDRGRCPRLRAGRAGLHAVQRPSRRAGPERLLLLRSIPRRGGAGSAPGGAPLRGLARRCRHVGRHARGDALPDGLSRRFRLLGAKELVSWLSSSNRAGERSPERGEQQQGAERRGEVAARREVLFGRHDGAQG